MTPRERAETVAVLYDWARWYDHNYQGTVPTLSGPEAITIMLAWMTRGGSWGGKQHMGKSAALALCFAAAMVAAGDQLAPPADGMKLISESA